MLEEEEAVVEVESRRSVLAGMVSQVVVFWQQVVADGPQQNLMSEVAASRLAGQGMRGISGVLGCSRERGLVGGVS